MLINRFIEIWLQMNDKNVFFITQMFKVLEKKNKKQKKILSFILTQLWNHAGDVEWRGSGCNFNGK